MIPFPRPHGLRWLAAGWIGLVLPVALGFALARPAAAAAPLGPPAWLVHGESASRYGESVAGAGDVNGDGFGDVVVGAIYYDNGETDEGGAWLYLGSAGGAYTAAAWHAEGNAPNALMGLAVATAGDVNGDGFDDVIIGIPGRAEAQVYLGSGSGLPASPDWTASGRGYFGRAVASAGDVNHDGFDDVIIGAMLDGADLQMEGRAFLYLGSPGGLAPDPAWVMEGNQAVCFFGSSVAGAGDVNGDGFDDVIIGAHYFDNGETDEGRAFVFHGSAAGLGSSPAWTAESDQPDTYFGFAAAGAGDVNGDAYDDVIIGATWWSQGEFPDDGEAVVYLGSPAGLAAAPAWAAYGHNSELGYSVAGAGDVNRDGYADVLAGEPHYQSGQYVEGAAHLFLGSPSGPSPAPDWTAELDLETAHLGQAVAGAGDVNGDGFPDVILGAPYSHCPLPPPWPPCGPINAFAVIYPATGSPGAALGPAPRVPALRLGEARPNPFGSSTVIPFTLGRAAQVRLAVADALGREVAVLDRGPRASGTHAVRWDGKNARGERLGAGVYFLRLSDGVETVRGRIVVVR